jgi:hypothetical protein
MRFSIVVLFVAAACGRSQPPAGPAHSPSDSPEAPTRCPEEREQAHKLRERWLDDKSAEVAGTLSRVVMDLARCERSNLPGNAIAAGTQDQILAALRERRQQVNSVVTLFREVTSYGDTEASGQAMLEMGQVQIAFAHLVADIPTPQGMDEPTGANFRIELAEAVDQLRMRAVSSLQGAVDAPGAPQVRDSACAELTKLGEHPPACAR